MREIKFRIRDEDGSVEIWELKELISSLYMEEYTVEGQYTGLKDKNGVEIYEGDIVEDTLKYCEGNTYRVVFFCEFKSGWRVNQLPRDVHINSEWDVVVGNIYENKELLDD